MGYNDSAKPPECTEAHLRFLDRLRKGGTVNMLVAGPHLAKAFGLERALSLFILKYWIATYSERHHGKIESQH